MNQTTPPNHWSRRQFLRGVGVTMALPWLESLPLIAGGRPAGDTGQPTMRLAVMFSGNGFASHEWWAKGQGAQMELGKVLTPLQPLREKMTLIEGLFNPEAQIGGIHSAQTGQLLSGAHLAPGGAVLSGTSMDQIIAQRLGGQTKVPSLVLGCEPSLPSVHKDYSMIYSSHISWSSPTTPTPLELFPALAFDRLFRDEPGRADRSILDSVLSEAGSLSARVSTRDRRRVDEYLTAVREVEQKIERAGQERQLQGWRPTLARPDDKDRPADGIPQNIQEHMRLMCDLMILAFQNNTTRVCTLKLNNDWSQLRFPHLNVSDIHHLLSHVGGANWLKVNQFFLEQVAYVAGRLEAIKEGDRSLLDNTMLVYLSSMLTGDHRVDKLPVLLLGGGGAQIKTGRVINYEKDPDRKICRLYLSLMNKMGVRLDRFGDATSPLSEV